MRKFFFALMLLTIMLTSSVEAVVYEESTIEGSNLTAVKKIAIAMPNFYKVDAAEPEIHDLIKLLYDSGKSSSTLEIVSYDDVAAAIRRDTGIDILSLDVPEAMKVYKRNIMRYADAYVIETIANSDKFPQLFFYLYNAADSKLMYTYKIRSRLYQRNKDSYARMADAFFIRFDEFTVQNLSKEEQKILRKKQEEIREKKRKAEKLNVKTSKNKVDMVKKK